MQNPRVTGHVGFTQILKAGLAGQEKYGMVRVPLQSTWEGDARSCEGEA
jgi:hypothetical protein